MSEVKRYALEEVGHYDAERDHIIIEDENGEYVLASDYAVLSAKFDELRKYARHTDECARTPKRYEREGVSGTTFPFDAECTCGLISAITRIGT